MRIIIVGAGGFIGARIVAALVSRGGTVICAGRKPDCLRQRFPASEILGVNLTTDTTDVWRARLDGVDGLINAAGVLRGELESVHHRGAAALFEACADAGIAHVVQISALGAGAQPESQFLATKYAADLHLLRLANERRMKGWCVVRPSLVIGRGGGSTELFSALAAAPWPVRLGSGTWQIQPIYIDDLARVAASLVECSVVPPVLDAVGPEPMTTDELTRILRGWLGLPPRRFITVPLPLMQLGAWIGNRLPTASLNTETLLMLARGNTGDPAPLATALHRMPRRLDEALAREPSVRSDRWLARMLPVHGLLLAALLAVWVGSGVASLAVTPERAQALLFRFTYDPGTAMILTWGGAALDVLLGLALLAKSWRPRVLKGQLVVLLAYTALATVALPALWADPFGSLLKNLAVLAATLALLAVED